MRPKSHSNSASLQVTLPAQQQRLGNPSETSKSKSNANSGAVKLQAFYTMDQIKTNPSQSLQDITLLMMLSHCVWIAQEIIYMKFLIAAWPASSQPIRYLAVQSFIYGLYNAIADGVAQLSIVGISKMLLASQRADASRLFNQQLMGSFVLNAVALVLIALCRNPFLKRFGIVQPEIRKSFYMDVVLTGPLRLLSRGFTLRHIVENRRFLLFSQRCLISALGLLACSLAHFMSPKYVVMVRCIPEVVQAGWNIWLLMGRTAWHFPTFPLFVLPFQDWYQQIIQPAFWKETFTQLARALTNILALAAPCVTYLAIFAQISQNAADALAFYIASQLFCPGQWMASVVLGTVSVEQGAVRKLFLRAILLFLLSCGLSWLVIYLGRGVFIDEFLFAQSKAFAVVMKQTVLFGSISSSLNGMTQITQALAIADEKLIPGVIISLMQIIMCALIIGIGGSDITRGHNQITSWLICNAVGAIAAVAFLCLYMVRLSIINKKDSGKKQGLLLKRSIDEELARAQ